MTLEPIICPNCGSNRVDTARLVCEFCGSKFKRTDPDVGIVRFEHYTAPTRVLRIESRIPNEFIALCPEHVLDKAKTDIAERLAHNLLSGGLIEFTSEMDFAHCEQVISARLRVLEPRYRF